MPFGPEQFCLPGDGSMTISDSIISDNSGPGVKNYFFLTILNSTLSGNSADDGLDGGGISSGTFKSPGGVTVINSTISGNSTSGGGGGIAIDYGGGLTIVNSTISGNSAEGAGGGISSTSGNPCSRVDRFPGNSTYTATTSGNSAALRWRLRWNSAKSETQS